MRLHLSLTPNTEAVPFNYQHHLTGVLHKWLGENDLHDKISLYSFSWLRGNVKTYEDGLHFPDGAKWFISFWEKEYGPQLIQGVVDQPEMLNGITVNEVQVAKTPKFDKKFRFKAASPILIRNKDDNNNRKHLTFNDKDAGKYLLRTFKTKLSKAELENSTDNIKLYFDQNYPSPKTKLINIKGTNLRANLCPVIMEGNPKAIEFAWNVGLGELTGSGFGAVC